MIQVLPLDLAFRYVENSTIIKFFQDAGVNLDLFYRLLWRHALISELIKGKYNLSDENSTKRWFDNFWIKFNRGSPKAKTLSYLRSWGDKFWLDTETRMKEVASRIEKKFEAAIDGMPMKVPVTVGSGLSLTDSERAEVVTRGSAVAPSVTIDVRSPVLVTLGRLERECAAL